MRERSTRRDHSKVAKRPGLRQSPAAFIYALAFATVLPAIPSPLQIPQIRSYQTGEVADTDIITPVPLIITEYEAPKKRAPEPQPVVYVHDTAAVADAQAHLRSAVVNLREEFLDKLVIACTYRQLTPQQAQHPGFAKFVTWFQNQHKNFPLTAELADDWATGQQQSSRPNAWREALIEATKLPLVSALPDPALQVHLITAEDRKKLQWGNLGECLGPPANIAQFRSLADAKKQLLRSFADEPKAGEFLAQFLKENCLPDPSLSTLADWAQKPAAEPPTATERSYRPGQMVVRRGQRIDASTKAAIDMLRAKREQTAGETTQNWTEAFVPMGRSVRSLVSNLTSWIEARWQSDPPLTLGVSATFVILAAGLLIVRSSRLRRSRRIVAKQTAYTVVFNPGRKETVFLPVKADGAPRGLLDEHAGQTEAARWGTPLMHLPAWGADEPSSPSETPLRNAADKPRLTHDVVMMDWESRIQDTEMRAQELLDKVRAGLAPYLAKEMMSDLVRKLIADRMGLIQAQNIATREIALLEQRFAKIHAELQQRLQMYQERNAFLEEKLAERTAESQELIKIQIEALEKRLSLPKTP